MRSKKSDTEIIRNKQITPSFFVVDGLLWAFQIAFN